MNSVLVVLALLASTPALDAEATLSFARDLAAQKDYYRAITEYRRFAHLAPEDERAVTALETAGWLAIEAKKYDEAQSLFAAASRRAREMETVAATATPSTTRFGRAVIWDEQGYDIDAANEYAALVENAETEGAPEEMVAAAAWAEAWARFDAKLQLASSRRASRRLTESMGDIFEFADDPVHGERVRAMRLHAARRRLPRRVPAVAALLNLAVPGAGFAYAGRFGPAIASFLLNGAFITAIVWAVQKRNYPLAAAALGLEVGWYFGGAQGAGQAVLDANEKALTETRDWYRERYFGPVYRP